MKAIAFAIIIASLNLLPAAEFKAAGEFAQISLGIMYLVCLIGFAYYVFKEPTMNGE